MNGSPVRDRGRYMSTTERIVYVAFGNILSCHLITNINRNVERGERKQFVKALEDFSL